MARTTKMFLTLLLLCVAGIANAADYYLVGNMNEWTPADAYKLVANEGAATEEYMITLDLAADAQFKIVGVVDGTQTWYPAGQDNDYVVAKEGNYTVYFRPKGDGNADWYYNYFYVASNTTADPNDYTSYIVNADLKGEGGFDATGTKGIDGSGIVKCANNAQFDFKQTIAGLPAGKYKLTAQAAYRYSGSEADEAAAIAAGTDTKLAALYATVGKTTVGAKVMNRYDGASDTDYANGDGSVTVNGKFVPNSSKAVQAWFAAGQYVNEVVFNLVEDGDVTIGLVKSAQPEAGDYTVIGPWTLTRLGDAEAVEEPGLVIPEGRYYIIAMGEEENNLMAAGNTWGTKGIINGTGIDFILTYNESNGTYDFDTRISNGGNNHYLGSGLWMDSSSWGWTIEEADYGHYISSTFDGVKKYIGVSFNGELELTETPYAWAFMIADTWENSVKKEGLATMAKATADNPADATFLIKSAGFNRNDQRNNEAWTVSEDCTNKNLGGGGSGGNGCAESWHSTFTISQLLADAPAGVYVMTAQGFYRQDDDMTEDAPLFFANDEMSNVPVRTGSENGMDTAGDAFAAGKYNAYPIVVSVASDGALTVGIKGTAAHQWVIWDNFQLSYYGADADAAAVKAAIDEAIAKENAEKAKAIAAELLPKMKQVVESTNVYTAEAYEEYYGQWQAKYDAGTLTIDEANALQDPYAITGWHAANTVDDLLVSAWDVAPETWEDYHVNTWSTEGTTDGTGFVVPFIEYWTNDTESLAEKTLTATMNGIAAGNYKVSAWVRVRGKNDFTLPAYGITLQVNDGEAMNAIGNRLGENSNFYLANISAIGAVGEDGVLNIKFNVAADNNISWLSFQKVVFEEYVEDIFLRPEDGADIAAALTAATEGKNVGNITIELAKEGNYTTSATLTAPNKFYFWGNDATVTVDGEMTDPFITLDGTKTFAMKSETEASDHKYITEIEVKGVTIVGLQNALIKDNQKTLVETVHVDWANIQIPASNKNVFDFNGKGYIGEVKVTNSTIWAADMNTGFFAQYGSRPKNINGEWLQKFNIANSTIVNIANGKNMCDLKQNGTAQNVYYLNNNIFVNCGKQNQVVVGFNKGQTSATPDWAVAGNYFEWGGVCVNAEETAKAGQKDGEDIVKSSVEGKMAFADAANGDFNGLFTLAEGATAPESLGAPMWTVKFAVRYYLVGNMNEWTPAEAYLLTPNMAAEGDEYMITLDLAEGAEFKIVTGEVENLTWYPAGQENNFVVEKEGNYTVYFRPNADGGDDWFYNVIYAAYNDKNGDVNGDGTVDVADIASVISVMAGTAEYAAADVNGDGVVDVADIATIISIMAAQ